MDLFYKMEAKKLQLRRALKPILPAYRWAYGAISGISRENKKRFEASRERLLELKNSQIGKRCFIIGNGPSLCAADLDKIKSEFCFGTNGIYNIFEKTDWRPSIYCISDPRFLHKYFKEISDIDIENKIIVLNEKASCPPVDNALYVYGYMEICGPDLPRFSEDLTKCVFDCGTITYNCLQVAAYMGFREIFLLGVDHTFSVSIGETGKIEQHDVEANHFYSRGDLVGLPRVKEMELGYKAAKEYADEHGIKIYNATRGGKLEVFDRVNFDDISFSDVKIDER